MKFALVDWPETASFLANDERRVLQLRLTQDRKEEAQMNRLDPKTLLRAYQTGRSGSERWLSWALSTPTTRHASSSPPSCAVWDIPLQQLR